MRGYHSARSHIARYDQEDPLALLRTSLHAIALSLALVACKPQAEPAGAAMPAATAEAASAAPAASTPATAAATPAQPTACPTTDFSAFLKSFSADIAAQEKATADPLTMIRIDPDAQPEPAPITRQVALADVQWPVIPNLDVARSTGREVAVSEDAGGRQVLVRTPDSGDQQVYHFAQRPCWTLVKVDDQSL
ncbi:MULTISPECIES: hypothetical protein [Xanthomonas]|uniref:hypothetical protein n=2 Tax=Xanthomonas TaxID=338 RepID=UPI001FD32BE1|nr:hypothetical protein [Xanthomonas phaseoli]